jgi:hypothetical protein
VKESRVVGNRRHCRHSERGHHRPGIRDELASEGERRADEPREEQRQSEQTAEDAAPDDRICERGYEGSSGPNVSRPPTVSAKVQSP